MTALAVCSFGTSAFAQSYTVEMQVVTKTDNQSKDETAKLALKSGSKFRVEQFTKLFNRIVIVNGGDSWSFDPASKTGMHARQDAKAVARLDAQGSSGLKIYAAFLKSGGKQTGTEVIDGQKCNVLQYRKANGMVHKLWVLPGEQHLPRRLMESGVVRAATSLGEPMATHVLNRQTDFLKWKVGLALDESLFKPPVGVTFQQAPPRPASNQPSPKK